MAKLIHVHHFTDPLELAGPQGRMPRVDGDVEDDDDVEMGDDPSYEEDADASRESRIKTVQFTLVPDDEEEKPKPILKLKYQGFNIFGHCLCIVVEPWPPIRTPSRAPSILRSTTCSS
ncbi:hypothetical protein MPER_08541 [Moniliophthora perniciosa FA553]|nr:hypothetical protein MPER_08541 [Moniliophthora perniciosa FA553]